MQSLQVQLAERAAAARALAEQMRGMLLAQWRTHAHVCENYSPARHAANCTGDRFHQWGALAGLLRLGEEGHVNLPRLAKLRAKDGAAGSRAAFGLSVVGAEPATPRAIKRAKWGWW